MSLLMVCDAPNCFNTITPAVRLGRPAAPNGWWMSCTEDGRILVSCCDTHLNVVIKQGKGKSQ